MQTRTFTALIPVELAEQLDRSAKNLGSPRGWIITQALLNWMSLEERRHQMTLEALKEVDEGKFVDHEEIVVWANSLK